MEFNGSALIHSDTNIEPGNVEENSHRPMTLHCHQCSSVLADSFGICGDVKYLDSIICLSMLPYFFKYNFLSERCSNFFCRGNLYVHV